MDPVKHHYLITGEVIYSIAGEDDVRSARANGVLAIETRELPLKAIGKCQEILQMSFHQQFSRENQPPPTIHNVVILGLAHLGQFTRAQFHAGTEA